ncbi:MAG: hypothetical protein ACOCVX_01830 [Bacteroidales bacterium]
MDGKTTAIIAHITLIGWIIALVINSNEKNEFASFYIRQLLGLFLAGLILAWIPIIGWLLSIAVFVFWLISLITAIQGEMKEIPLVGHYFQDWFRTL